MIGDNPKVSEPHVTPFPMPLVIVGSKYDEFNVMDIEKKKQICRTLRSVAHSLWASLIFYSDKDAVLIKKLKDVLYFHGFGGSQWFVFFSWFIRLMNSNTTIIILVFQGKVTVQTIINHF